MVLLLFLVRVIFVLFLVKLVVLFLFLFIRENVLGVLDWFSVILFVNFVLIGLIFSMILVFSLVGECWINFLYLGMYCCSIFGLFSVVYIMLCGVVIWILLFSFMFGFFLLVIFWEYLKCFFGGFFVI